MRLGADPEIFLTNGRGNLISAIGRVGGTKQEPRQVAGLPKGFTVQEDNVAMELGIPPAATQMEWLSNIQTILRHAQIEINKADLKGPVKFSKLACAVFPKKELEHPLANIFGCEPDYNAWTQKENPRVTAENPHLRSAGGHIHVETEENPLEVIKWLDLYIGIPLVIMEKGPEAHQRRQLYGKAGAFRFKPYGVEYRTPSNYWIFKDSTIKWVWKAAEMALNAAASGISLDGYKNQIQKAINTNNTNMAQQLMNKFGLGVPV